MPARLAIAPGSWGVEPPGDPNKPPYRTVLDEIREAGYLNLELGPVGYLPEDPERLRVELEGLGLQLVGGYAMESFHRVDHLDENLAVVERTCRVLSAAGAARLILIEALIPRRARAAGREGDAERLDDGAWHVLVSALSRAAEVARDFGLRATFHPHAGTSVEFRDEIDRLMGDLDGGLMGLCVDTGHSTIAGIDPVELLEVYGERVDHLHLKDVNAERLERLRGARASFEEMVTANVFTPLGRGDVDLPAFACALSSIEFDGCATVEQDRLIGDPHALPDAAASFGFAVRCGFSSARARPISGS